MLLRLCAAAALLAACGDDGGAFPDAPATCGTGPVAAEVVYGDYQSATVVADGGDVPLLRAPQGGYIVLIAPRFQWSGASLPPCSVRVNAALRDPGNGRVVGLEERDITMISGAGNTIEPANPGSLSSYANVAACPSAAASVSVDGHAFGLELRVTENGVEVASVSQQVVPRCATGDTECEDECAPIAP